MHLLFTPKKVSLRIVLQKFSAKCTFEGASTPATKCPCWLILMNTTKQRRQHVAKIHKCNVTWLNVTQQCKFNFEKSARCEYVIINQIEGLKRVTQMSNSVGFHLTTHCMLPAACHHHNSSNETMGPPAPQSSASVLPMVILP